MATSSRQRRLCILISGAYGFKNIGDEAMLGVVCKTVSSALPDASIVIVSADPEAAVRLHHHPSIGSLSPWSAVRALARSGTVELRKQLSVLSSLSAIIFGGGSILNDNKGSRGLAGILSRVMIARVRRSGVLFWGVSVGPFKTRMGRALARLIFRCADKVLVRDLASFHCMRELGVPAHRVCLGADLLFGVAEPARSRARRGPAVDRCLRIGLSLRPFPANLGVDSGTIDEILLQALCSAFQALDQQVAIEIVPLVFSEGEGAANDLAMIEAFTRRNPQLRFERVIGKDLLAGSGGMESILAELLEAISTLDVLVGERFHSMVLAARAGVPFVPIVYDQKVGEVARTCALDRHVADLRGNPDAHALSAGIYQSLQAIVANLDSYRAQVQQQAAQQHRMASRDLALVQALLRKGGSLANW